MTPTPLQLPDSMSSRVKVSRGDALHLPLEASSVDLVFTSPPYEDARTYGMDFKLRGQDWIAWAVPRFLECLHVCRGLVAWVVQGRTKNYRWSATPALLMAALHDAGVKLRNPPVCLYQRSGIPGNGGPDWLRSDYEWIICASHGRLPWSDNTALGHPPKCKPGGDPTYRMQDGHRVRVAPGKGKRLKKGTNRGGNRMCEQEQVGSETVEAQPYIPPKIANPGNVIRCSGGHLGSDLAHENEAPFPEALVEFFVRSFCPPKGTVLDPFCGSGTTLAVARRLGRNAIGVDIRQSQVKLTRRRLALLPATPVEVA